MPNEDLEKEKKETYTQLQISKAQIVSLIRALLMFLNISCPSASIPITTPSLVEQLPCLTIVTLILWVDSIKQTKEQAWKEPYSRALASPKQSTWWIDHLRTKEEICLNRSSPCWLQSSKSFKKLSKELTLWKN